MATPAVADRGPIAGATIAGGLIAILLLNAAPLVGVLAFGWSVSLLMLLYWMENVAVGVFTVCRMITSAALEGGGGPWFLVILIPFFLLHYGAFCMAHLLFLGFFFLGGNGAAAAALDPAAFLMELWRTHAGDLRWALAALAALQAVLFLDWIRRGGARRDSVRMAMGKPYARIIFLHLTIIIAAAAALALGQPWWSVAVLVGVKTAFDLAVETRRLWRRPELVSIQAR